MFSPVTRRSWLLVVLLAVAGACSSFKDDSAAAGADASDGDGGASDDGGGVDDDGAAGDGASLGDGTTSGGDGSIAACTDLVLPCLDSAPDNVIEVPTEKSATDAFAQAKANDVIQINGNGLGAGWRVPAFVTLRGCNGARIGGPIAFGGSGGTVEGFLVTAAGSIVANATGSFIVRRNRFVGPAPDAGSVQEEPGVSGRSIDGSVTAQVTLSVEQCSFSGRSLGVEAATRYDTGTRTVNISIRNDVFSGVKTPIRIAEGGLAGQITATIEYDTFHAFESAVELLGVSTTTNIRGSIFAEGTKAVDADSPYVVDNDMTYAVTSASPAPLSGSFATGDPLLAGPTTGDFHLGAGSAARDRITPDARTPTDDYYGCGRPRGPKADIGAVEMQ